MTRVLFAYLLLVALPAWAAQSNDDIKVHVERHGATFVIDVEVPLDVSPEEAWETISDYDHMAQFVSNISYSKILSRDGNKLRVMQKGSAGAGPLKFGFENVRDVVLVPPSEIRTKLVSGNLKRAESLTRLVPTARGSRLINHGEYIPTAWVPPVVGPAVIASETREQYAEVRDEIHRRKARVARTER